MKKIIAIGFAGIAVASCVAQTINYGNIISNSSAMATQTSTIKSSNLISSTIDSLVNRFTGKNRLFDGITITSAVASNSAINNKALEITKGATNDLEKAQDIYLWIASNINYSNSLEKAVENNEDLTANKLGAIATFNSKSGICIGFASLYTAMAKANGLQVREVYGKGYTGQKWMGHMWNEVYIPSLGQWINVDSTFASAFFKAEKDVNVNYNPIGALNNKTYVYKSNNGEEWTISPQDYFNSDNFNETHDAGVVVGQW